LKIFKKARISRISVKERSGVCGKEGIGRKKRYQRKKRKKRKRSF
jgi:hypothetical protein